MSMTLKTTAAAVALLVAGSANAAILNDATMTGDGELFINIVLNPDTTISTLSPATIVLDTNISANDLVSGAVTSWSSNAAQTTAVQSLLATSGATTNDFVFDAGARQNNIGNLDQFGLFLTNTDASLMPPPSDQINTFLGFGSAMNDWLFSVNQVTDITADGMLNPVSASSGLGVPGDWTNGFQGWNGNGNTLNWITTTDTAVSNSLGLYRYYYDANLAPVTDLWGYIDINTSTGVVSYNAVSAVPVPAAVWLFGSGLMGMVGVARRRKV